jgi:uncharacterized protein
MTKMNWILTADGADQPIGGYQLLLATQVPSIEVIAHSLAQINRYTGHASRPYSVAEHSVLVADILAARGFDHHAQRAGLMHDAHECLAGDASSPAKSVIGLDWYAFETPLDLLIQSRYGLKTARNAYRAAIKDADLTALATERRDLMPFDAKLNVAWDVIDTPGQEVEPMDNVDLNSPVRASMTWRHHQGAFVARWTELTALCKQMPGVPA